MIGLSQKHQSLFKKFQRCVDQNSIEKMDKQLYHFFMYHCGFIAHYNIHGFKSEYSGRDFLRWFQVFENPNWLFFHEDEYNPLRKACVQYAKEKASLIRSHFARLERNQKIMLLHSLQKELGVVESVKESATYLQEEDDGQLSLFV